MRPRGHSAGWRATSRASKRHGRRRPSSAAQFEVCAGYRAEFVAARSADGFQAPVEQVASDADDALLLYVRVVDDFGGRHAPARLAERFWLVKGSRLTGREAQDEARLDLPAWRAPGERTLRPLLTSSGEGGTG